MNNLKRSFGLDLLRSIAISLVLIAHFAKIFESIGFWGVELFFALSGYLIGKIIWNNFKNNTVYSWKLIFNFWQRRWFRTFPNYWLFIIIMVVFQFFKCHSIPNIIVLLKSILFIQNFNEREEAFFSVSWSLCIEEWFYLYFPLLLFIVSKIKLSKIAVFSICILFTILISIIFRNYLIQAGVGHSLRGITLARLDAIVYGVTIAFLVKIIDFDKIKLILITSIGLIILGFEIIRIHFSGINYELIRSSQLYLMLTPFAFALIIPAFEKIKYTNFNFYWFGNIIKKISLWSYSIYLSHIPIMFLAYKLIGNIRENNFGNLVSKVVGLIFTIYISALLYKYFEKPLTNLRPKEL